MAERAASAGALLAIAVCCGVPAVGGAAVAAVATSVVARSFVLGVVVLGLLALVVLHRMRRRSASGCPGAAAPADEGAEMS